jgi:Ser/Thr protein kinase RdoA (MazF antagonist)
MSRLDVVDDVVAPEPGDLYSRPALDEPAVGALLERLGVGDVPRDLGGTMSLNAHLEDLGLVLRVHARFEKPARVMALRDLRRQLAARGLIVGVPELLLGDEILVIDGRVAEAERFVEALKPDPTWGSYVWMYDAMGRLHRAITEGAVRELPVPRVATYASPAELRMWIDATSVAVRVDEHAAGIAAQVTAMVGDLERRWTSAEHLPQQIVHGDIRLGNVTRTGTADAAYFDFGFAAQRPRIHELAYSLFWIVLEPDDSGRPDNFNWSRVAELIEAYEAAAGDQLEDIERRALGAYVAAVPMYLAAIASYTPDPCDRIKQEIRSLEIARWVLDHADHLLA